MRRLSDIQIAAAGAVVGATAAVVWGDPGLFAAPALLGASLGLARRHPQLAWAAAVAILLATAATGEVPGGDVFVLLPLIAAHAVCAGRWDERWSGYASVAALTAASVGNAVLSHDAPVPFVIFVPAMWAAGRALRERERVARQLAERARELEEEREAYAALSVRYERARIASELHDIVAHAISVMVVQASAGQRLTHDPEATAETFEAIAGAARQAERDMGRLVALLGDERAIGPAPDLALVEELVARAAGSGLDVTLRLEGEREGLPAEVGEAAYRVVQEGLTNALRYAAGAHVAVRVRARDELVVEVENDATDARPALAGAGTGNGLRGLRERVDACGGLLEAGPTAGDGWLVSARLPRRIGAGVGHAAG